MSDLTDDLDMSWLVETERLSKIDQNFARENMNEIQLHSIYINKTNHIDKITSSAHALMMVDLSNRIMGLTNEYVLQLVESMKLVNGIKYKLLDILVFNVDLEPENIQAFSQTCADTCQSRFLKTYSVIQDIKIPASIFIFHNLNSIYMIFQEIVLLTNPYTSILKHNNVVGGTNLRKTKKVSIHLPDDGMHVRKTKYSYREPTV